MTHEALLEAATRILERDGLAAFTTNRVAEVAGVSIGSLYQYNPNKDALVTALIERAQAQLTQALSTLVAVLTNARLAPVLRALATFAVDQQYTRPQLAAALDSEERRLPVQDILSAAEDALVQIVSDFLHAHRAELAPSVPSTAARDCVVITKALVEAEIAQRRAAPPDLEDRIVHALTGYLLNGYSPR